MVAFLMTTAERTAKAFDFAQDLTKLLITLATGIITITITFLNDVAKHAPASAHKWIEIAWLLYLLSIVGGIMALMGMTGSLDEKEVPSIDEGSVAWPARVQFLLFAVALAATIFFGTKAV
ncbi:MAG TPA: hypothetical protein VMH33_00395 [Solirubrobacterales bacterium]|nr:hypothetical protein [Solirubrobacterales bacterium]